MIPIAPRPAFSLIELLVVVTIIAVLLAILTPALDRAMEMARLAQCMSNEKNIYLAFRSYVIDNRDRGFNSRNWHRWHVPASASSPLPVPLPTDPPPAPTTTGEGATSASTMDPSGKYIDPTHTEAYWAVAYRTYGGVKALYHCPSTTALGDTSATDGKLADGHKFTTYSLNGVRASHMGSFYPQGERVNSPFFESDSDTSPAVRFPTIIQPAAVVFVMDHFEAKFDANGDLPVNHTQWTGDPRRQSWRHLEGTALLWGDGHVTHYQPSPLDSWEMRWFTGTY